MLTLSLRIFGWTLLDVAVLAPPENAEPGYLSDDVGIAAVVQADDGDIRLAHEDRLGFIARADR